MAKTIRQRIETLEQNTSKKRPSEWKPVLVVAKGGVTQHAVNTNTGETNHDPVFVDGLFRSLRTTGGEIQIEYGKGTL